MPKLTCKCGVVINLSTWVSDSERMFILERQFSKVADLIDNLDRNSEKLIDIMYDGEIDAIFCQSCNRIHLDNGDGSYVTYSIEK